MLHVLPVQDSKGHKFESTCECGPSAETESGGLIIVHEAFDGRSDNTEHDGWIVVDDKGTIDPHDYRIIE